MVIENTHKEVIIAYANGYPIECRDRSTGIWHLTAYPAFYKDLEYRAVVEEEGQ